MKTRESDNIQPSFHKIVVFDTCHTARNLGHRTTENVNPKERDEFWTNNKSIYTLSIVPAKQII
jgi:hypothetical protein